jgi:hypothetical protein
MIGQVASKDSIEFIASYIEKLMPYISAISSLNDY